MGGAKNLDQHQFWLMDFSVRPYTFPDLSLEETVNSRNRALYKNPGSKPVGVSFLHCSRNETTQPLGH